MFWSYFNPLLKNIIHQGFFFLKIKENIKVIQMQHTIGFFELTQQFWLYFVYVSGQAMLDINLTVPFHRPSSIPLMLLKSEHESEICHWLSTEVTFILLELRSYTSNFSEHDWSRVSACLLYLKEQDCVMRGEMTPHQSEDLQKCMVAGVYLHLHKFPLLFTGICTDFLRNA